MPSGSYLWSRLRGIWKMLWPTNRLYPSLASVVVLDVLLRQRTGIQMAKDAGQSNLQSSFSICLRMPRVMLKYVSSGFSFAAHLHHFIFSDNCQLIYQVKGLDVDALYISHIQVNQAQKQRRRTYRAHGRINRMFQIFQLSFCCDLVVCSDS